MHVHYHVSCTHAVQWEWSGIVAQISALHLLCLWQGPRRETASAEPGERGAAGTAAGAEDGAAEGEGGKWETCGRSKSIAPLQHLAYYFLLLYAHVASDAVRRGKAGHVGSTQRRTWVMATFIQCLVTSACLFTQDEDWETRDWHSHFKGHSPWTSMLREFDRMHFKQYQFY